MKIKGESVEQNDSLRHVFNERFNNIVRDKRVSYKHISDNTGIGYGCINRINSQLQVLSIDNIVKFCNTFKVNIDYLFGKSDDKYINSDVKYIADNIKIRDKIVEVTKYIEDDLSLKDLSDKYHVSQYVIRSMFVLNDERIRPYKLLRICDMLGINPSEFFIYTEKDKNKNKFSVKTPGSVRISISMQLRKHMKYKNMTADQISMISGVSVNIINDLINGLVNYDPYAYHIVTLTRIAEALDIYVTQLLCFCTVNKDMSSAIQQRYKKYSKQIYTETTK